MLFYDGHDSHFDDRKFGILRRHNIHYLILKAGDYVHDQEKNTGKNTKLKNLYGNEIMNWVRHHGTLKFTPTYMNYVLV